MGSPRVFVQLLLLQWWVLALLYVLVAVP